MSYVLIVDDDPDFSSVVSRVVGSIGHETAVAPSIAGATRFVASRRPDLIILDVMFPENDSAGFEFARAVARETESKGHPKIPVLMLTAINKRSPLGFGPKDIDDTWLPVDDFVEKPVDLELLKTKVSKILSQA
jgi:CheY-like chemotaxis protein